MFKMTTKTVAEVASLAGEARELSANELDTVAGGMQDVGATFQVGNDKWIMYANANGYAVEHVHIGK